MIDKQTLAQRMEDITAEIDVQSKRRIMIQKELESNDSVNIPYEVVKNMMGYLQAIEIDDDLSIAPQAQLVEGKNNYDKIIFISHSSLDIKYVKPFVDLLEGIGFAGKGKIFCSSLSGYWIPKGKNIYDYIKEQLDKEVHVILFLSDNYYSSPACMNEMGATWIKAKEHTAILTPGFNYSQIRGAIDLNKIWFKLNDKERINEFKDELIGEFQLITMENIYC